MDANVIEELAVGAISYKANRSSQALQAAIPIGDKGISLDGEIIVFNDDKRKKNSRPTSCRVQVKGKKVKKLSDKKTKRQVEIEDLRNFIQHRAVIYFVVEIDEQRNTKIFFKLLTLIQMDELIGKYGKQKTTKLEFISLGEEKDALLKLCKRCIYNKNIQMQLPEDREYDLTRTKVISPDVDLTEESIQELFYHESIIIGETKDGFTIPLDIINIVGITVSTELKFSLNGHDFNLFVTVKNEKDSRITEVELEETITLYLDPGNNRIQFKNHSFNNLAAQLKVFPLFLEFSKGGDFFINDKLLGTINPDRLAEEKVLQRIEGYEKLKKSFTKANISDSMEIGETEYIQNEINIFVDIVLNEKYDLLSLPENIDDYGFIIAPYNLGNAHFLMCYVTETLYDVSENLPRFFSIYASPMERFKAFVATSENEKKFDISVYVPITLYNLMRSDDIDSSIVIDALNRSEVFSASELQHDINEFGLNCLRVYDKKGNQEWLHIAEHIFNTLSDKVSKINHAQTIKRLKGTINNEQEKSLFNIKVNLTNDTTLDELSKRQMIFCTTVLLGQFEESNNYFDSFSKEQQKIIQEWPIFQLYNK